MPTTPDITNTIINDKSNGLFITFEGIDGSGKSTQVDKAYDMLKYLGIPVIKTREPGGTDLGVVLRDRILNGKDMDARAELLLFLADRAQHVAKVIKPALARGEVVLCDRYEASTMAYQAWGGRLSVTDVRGMSEWSARGLKPDAIYFLDVPIEEAMKRLTNRQGPKNNFDLKEKSYYESVRTGFVAEAGNDPDRWIILHGGHKVNVTHELISAHLIGLVEEMLGRKTSDYAVPSRILCPICTGSMFRSGYDTYSCPKKHGKFTFTE